MGKLWFDHPAGKWEEALPIGNGRLGAMIFGGLERERIALNQDSIWYGGPIDRVNPDARKNLDNVRSLLLEGKIPQAEELLCLAFSGTPQGERPYQALGDLEIFYRDVRPDEEKRLTKNMNREDADETYRRGLELNIGIVREEYCAAGRRIKKEYFASYPHGLIVIRMQAEEGGISLDARLGRRKFYDHVGKLDQNTIYMDGTLGEGGVSWMAAVRAECKGGDCRAVGEHLVIRDAEEIVMYLGCETSFYETDYRKELRDKIDTAVSCGYEEVRKQHIADHQELFDRVSLQIGTEGIETEDDCRSIEEQFCAGTEKGFSGSFATLYFQYGRYLLMASSRPGSLPTTLQGIWNDAMEPCWDSKYTININTEMNYWPAEMCGLAECHQPLFDHLLRMWEIGRYVAREMYGCRGFVAHHNTDIWGDCAPQDIYIPATYWVMGAAWLCTHIWRHYIYTGDEAFLKRMYPILEDAVLFFHDYLIEVDGKLMTCPSVSPENTYILSDGVRGCMGVGSTMDNEILRDLMEGYLKASDVLHKESEQVEKTKEILGKIPELQIGRHGQIMEWREDYEEQEPGHRHISHLYALHPSNQITTDKTPRLAEAARKTLERRLSYGGGHTGWSCAWIVNFYARLGDGEKALENLNKLWTQSTFRNLMDNHPMGNGFVFQIDGNLGATAAIAEMLVQSDEDRIILLPALPQQWSEGSARGIIAVGGVSINLSWKNGKLTECTAVSPKTKEVEFRYGTEKKVCRLAAEKGCQVFDYSAGFR